ncbi:DUF3726 domain-containing protein [Nioella sediminis]|jgi:hypothetical protein|uniref:DUF3726 domain-containing protein n=1 Tax=Nioella sediminis TaxID=1912092 RepID=UPI0008FD0AE2|nr:DUF3726 domain-containing protein [Nioella sediminis]TBX21188.1 hypothetical protein TK43_13325 [Roseovarius sp. JS7-11]
MSLSLNETESLAKTAARGAGLSWGMAEEAAKATRWLCARGIDACDPLVALLFRHDEEGHAQAGPERLDGTWRGAEGWLCPIACGAVLADLGPAAPMPLTLTRVALPVFLLPFAATLAKDLGQSVTLSWDGGHAATDGDAVSLDTPPPLSDVTLTLGGPIPARSPHKTRAETDQMILVSLGIYAARTRAPATEASRLAGAGAGLTDND